MERARWPGRQLMQRYPTMWPRQTVEGHSHARTSMLEDRLLSEGLVSSCCIYQGGDRVWAQKCTLAVPMWYNWSGGTGGSPLVGCSRSILILEK